MATEVQDAPASASDAESTRRPWWQPKAFDAFYEYPAFRYLWISNFLFFAGAWTQTLVLGWLVFDITDSEALLGIFTAARLSPMLLGPIGGVIADRVDRMKFLTVTQVMTLIVIALTTILSGTGHIAYWHILIAGFLLGMGQSPAQPARFTLVMDIAGRENVTNANALNAMALNSTRVIGPALGGVLIASLGVTGALALSTSWYALAIFALLPIRTLGRNRKTTATGSILGNLIHGIREGWANKNIRAILFVSFSANLCIFPIYQGFMPVFAETVFDVGVTGLSWIVGTIGVGQLTGSIAIASLGNFKFKGALFAFGTAIYGLFFVLFANAPWFPLALAFGFISGVGGAAFNVLQSTLLLLVADESSRGRMMGLQVLTIGVLPISTLACGFLVETIGVVATTTITGSMLALAMVGLWFAVPSFKRIGT